MAEEVLNEMVGSKMTKEEMKAFILNAHKEGLSRKEMAKQLGMKYSTLRSFVENNDLTRKKLNMRVPPKRTKTNSAIFSKKEKMKILMTEEQISALYAGRRYDSLNIATSYIGANFTKHRPEVMSQCSIAMF